LPAGEPVSLERGTVPNNPQQPQVAVDARGAIHVAYGVGHAVRYRRSNDGGKTFSPSVDLPAMGVISLGMRRGPRIAVANDAVCIAVIGGQQGKGRDGDVLAFRSADGGGTWTGPVHVNDVAASAREGLHAMAADPNGTLACVWLDLRNRRTEVMASTSTDGGAKWSKNTLVYKSPDGSVCECCHPSVTMDARGAIHVLWRNSLGGARDMYVATSTDGGQTFGAASKLGSGTWPLDACPMDGGAIAVTGDRPISVWRREKVVYMADGDHGERRLAAGEQPWIAASDRGAYAVWLTKRGDAAMLLGPGSSSPRQLEAHAADPVIAAGPGGRGPVVAAWEAREGKTYTIMCQVVE
jgi:hypothetical protein